MSSELRLLLISLKFAHFSQSLGHRCNILFVECLMIFIIGDCELVGPAERDRIAKLVLLIHLYSRSMSAHFCISFCESLNLCLLISVIFVSVVD